MGWRLRIGLGTAALALGCPHGGPDAGGPSPSSSPVLVSYRQTETGQGGMGGTTGSITVREAGTVTIEREVDGERRTFDCPPLDEAALAELAGLVQLARNAGLEARYDRSSLPEPQANYSRTRTVVLGQGSPIEVVIDGWADEPPELVAVEQRVEASAAGCTETGTTASGEGCYRSDPANMYRSTRLCLGPPEATIEGFVLYESQTVPDATLSETYSGRMETRADGIVLRADRGRSQTVNEQLGTTSGGPEVAAEGEWRLDAAGPSGERTLRAADGSTVVLVPE